MTEAIASTSGLIPAEPDAPTRLRVEPGPRPHGTGLRPRLSWLAPRGADDQLPHQVRATIDGTARTAEPADAPEPLPCLWPFPSLRSRSRVSWQVRVRSQAGWSDWSAPHEFEAGLLNPADWHARFIGIADPGPLPPHGRPGALFLRRRFTIREPPVRARVYATAQGVHELHLDGTRIGDLKLTPGFTACRSHIEVQAYDITGLCGPGEHELIATVTNGTALLAQIELFDQAGGRWSIATGTGWQAAARGTVSAAVPPESGWRDAVVLGTGERGTTPVHTRQD